MDLEDNRGYRSTVLISELRSLITSSGKSIIYYNITIHSIVHAS